jgi:hypothetical protein
MSAEGAANDYAAGHAAHSLEAELATLGAMLLAADALALAAGTLRPGDFYDSRTRAGFVALSRIGAAGRAADPVTVAEQLREDGTLGDAGGLQFIASVIDSVPTAAGVRGYVAIVAEKSAERRLAAAMAEWSEAYGDRIARAQVLAAADALRAATGASAAQQIPPPLSMREVLALDEPQDAWYVEHFLPASANVLIAAYPKSHKTNLLIAASVALALGVPALGRFAVPARRRVGLVLMEGAAHQLRRRIVRICEGYGRNPADLDGWLYIWFRPRLKFADAAAMRDLATHIRTCGLDAIGVDCWAPVATGNSNDADDVSAQLDAFADLRSGSENPGLSVVLIHHARKTQNGASGEGRITDLIRGSGGFGAWYDLGIALSRGNESLQSVSVRVEARDYPATAPYSFDVTDEHPATDTAPASGWMRVMAADPGRELSLDARILLFVEQNRGASKRAIREGIRGRKETLDAAVANLIARGALVNHGSADRWALFAPSTEQTELGDAA